MMKDKFLKFLKSEFRCGRLIEFAMCHQITQNTTEELINVCSMTRNDFPNVFEYCGIGKIASSGYGLPKTMANIKTLVSMHPHARVFALRETKSTVLDYHISAPAFK